MIRSHSVLITLLLVGSCQKGAESETRAINQPQAMTAPRITELSGRYQAARSASRLCIVDSRFALVIGNPAGATCSGSGRVARETDGIRFTMQGDSACSFVARTAGRSLVFPASVSSGCGYYCSAGAALAGVRFTQVGVGRLQAMKAKDLVGGALCGGDDD
jgi:hypothetical protein